MTLVMISQGVCKTAMIQADFARLLAQTAKAGWRDGELWDPGVQWYG